jgi:hypothetical protein
VPADTAVRGYRLRQHQGLAAVAVEEQGMQEYICGARRRFTPTEAELASRLRDMEARLSLLPLCLHQDNHHLGTDRSTRLQAQQERLLDRLLDRDPSLQQRTEDSAASLAERRLLGRLVRLCSVNPHQQRAR